MLFKVYFILKEVYLNETGISASPTVSGEGTETSYFYVTCLINVKTGKRRCASLIIQKAVRSGCSTFSSIGQACLTYDYFDSIFEHSHFCDEEDLLLDASPRDLTSSSY